MLKTYFIINSFVQNLFSNAKADKTLEEQEEELFKKPTTFWEKIRLYF
ncbi:hypothetical protein V6251_01315 [Olleya sp. Ti.3.14]